MNKEFSYYTNNINKIVKNPNIKPLFIEHKNEILIRIKEHYEKYKDVYEFDDLLNINSKHRDAYSFGCVNCSNCVSSILITDCSDCDHCFNCSNCNNCEWSHNLLNCVHLDVCENCENCKKCECCAFCKNCNNCRHLDDCENCENCIGCEFCKDLKNCKYLENYIDCKIMIDATI